MRRVPRTCRRRRGGRRGARRAAIVEQERLRYERGLAFLGTLGNNAPFVGLFGTVLGIIRAFHDLAGNSLQGSQAVMAGIAEALVATAVGLLVALPAVATYNAFIAPRRDRRGRPPTDLAHEALAVAADHEGGLRWPGRRTRRRGIIAEINVTPLVDIMLVLLIIFMLTAHLIAKQAIEVELPQRVPEHRATADDDRGHR